MAFSFFVSDFGILEFRELLEGSSGISDSDGVACCGSWFSSSSAFNDMLEFLWLLLLLELCKLGQKSDFKFLEFGRRGSNGRIVSGIWSIKLVDLLQPLVAEVVNTIA
jgi:hypothetical protein